MKHYRKNVRKRADGRYEARCIVGYNNIYGKAVYRYLYAKTYQKVVEKLECCEKENFEEVELQRVLRKNKKHKKSEGVITEKLKKSKIINSEGSSLFLQEWLVEWLENSKKAELKRSSYTQYCSVIQNHLIPEIGGYRLCELDNETVQTYVQNKIRQDKLSGATVKRHIAILSSALKEAARLEMIASYPCQEVKIPTTRKKAADVFDKAECRKLEMILKKDSDSIKATAVLLALKTGIRLGELAALRWQDIDFEEKTVMIRDAVHRVNTSGENLKKTEMIFEGTKSYYSERIIPMNDEIHSLLKDYEINLSEKSAFVFSNMKGSFIDPRVYQAYFAHILETAGIRKRNFHILRHTFATRAAGKNMQISVLSRILGHANIAITLKRYIHPLTEQDRIEMNKISEFPIDKGE
ncbi:site-specific integrase [Eubacterium sp. 1001713B170207_170306_E7]|uniref:tyrosine-type recombinase/integrase n=1 Tax=Eubacterium sp. 1001713B170207_170306_E7 TaxID=2787097 RepID=UPI00189BA3A2|nr:site-specific integrase [Eubacterium sp. 1001713B170207_170306_E7]